MRLSVAAYIYYCLNSMIFLRTYYYDSKMCPCRMPRRMKCIATSLYIYMKNGAKCYL